MDRELEEQTVVHAYGVVAGGTSVATPDTGIAGTGVALLDAGPVAAVFSRLPEATYGADAWREHADDPHWLAGVALQHQDVLARIVEETDVLPLRLPGMYRDEVQLHDLLTAEASLFEAALGAIHDHVEWGVQIFLSDTPAADGTRARPTSGRDYLRQRADATAERERGRGRRQALVQDAYVALADVARQSAFNPPQDPALTGRDEPMLLNAAYLVCRHHRAIFFAAVDEVASRIAPAGMTVEVSGPWAPYNFVDLGADHLESQS